MKNKTIERMCNNCQDCENCFLKFIEAQAYLCIKDKIETTREKLKTEMDNAFCDYKRKKKLYNKVTDEVKDAKDEYLSKKKLYDIYINGTSWIYEV